MGDDKTSTGERLRAERLRKLEELKERGIEPYPYKYDTNIDSEQIKEKYSDLEEQGHSGDSYRIAGRIMLMRSMGKATFMTIRDDKGDMQLFFRKDDVGKKYDNLKLFDLGDFIGAEGEVMRTKKGELSIYVRKFEFLSKAINPLPDKYHGVSDTELKYRKRYLDLIMNKESKDILRKKMQILKYVREFLDERRFMEVETPVLHTIYGGAAAKPFKTFHNEHKMDLFLRISPELYLKRLLVGGYERVYDINKNFRNEGIDTTHNPEFTMLEVYQAYADYKDMMKLTEEMFEYVATKINGKPEGYFKGKKIKLKAPWKKVKMLDAIKKYAEIDVSDMKVSELKSFVKKNKVEFDKEETWGNYVIAIFEHFCEDKFEQPTFIIDHPVESSPLCKKHKKDERLIERFEPFCMGMELANAYSELNDPIVQRKLLEDQSRQLRGGDEEANPLDEDFLQAIEQGMPPAGGLGVGIDRMAMLILGQESIRDVILFPTMKPEVKDNSKKDE